MSRLMFAVMLAVVLTAAVATVAAAQGPQCAPPVWSPDPATNAWNQALYNTCVNSYAAQNYAAGQAQWGYNNAANQWGQAQNNAQQFGQEFNRGINWADQQRQNVRNSCYFCY